MKLYKYSAKGDGHFAVSDPLEGPRLYFPLVNDAGLLSSISPDLSGDIKLDQHRFLTLPVVTEDLQLSRASRNFWLRVHTKSAAKKPDPATLWSVTGRSHQQKITPDEDVRLKAGFLWHRIWRRSKVWGLQASVLNFVPKKRGTFEVMFVEVKNISTKKVSFTATSALPLFGRSADRLRDHRHVTSLLHRLTLEKHGVHLRPTMSFDERGHTINTTSYYVFGVDGEGNPPAGVFPTIESFIGAGGDLECPRALLEERRPFDHILEDHQGKEAMGALQFAPVELEPGESVSYSLLLGIGEETSVKASDIESVIGRERVWALLKETEDGWAQHLSPMSFQVADDEFNQWMRWVALQPTLRKLFGCSFLPDFDYGRGGRGWRDLWQDSLALILTAPRGVREDLKGYFSGVRMDGTNATIIIQSKNQEGCPTSVKFVADRNDIARTWMDHGVWPFFTTHLYIQQTGDWRFLLEKGPYFRDSQLNRGREHDPQWDKKNGDTRLRTSGGHVYGGTLLEHVLIQMLVPFFNVGAHNNIRLEDGDWNDGLDMAAEKGESVAFTSFYAGNMEALASLLVMGSVHMGGGEVHLAEEVLLLLDRASKRVNYDSVEEKRERLQNYFDAINQGIKGTQAAVPLSLVISDLKEKAAWIKNHINQNEWIEKENYGWFNGYYDNRGLRVEGGRADGGVNMTLTGQVFAIGSGLADEKRVLQAVNAINIHLVDPTLNGVRLNTDWGGIKPDLGRAFSFVYGEKENGAVFSHMVVMLAYALYRRGFVNEGFGYLSSLFNLAKNSERSRIYPGLPEYFNKEGEGRYAFLTGSASWYVLTLLTEVFGIKGLGGDLLIEPKLHPTQFDKNGEARVVAPFAGVSIQVTYRNPAKIPYEKWTIQKVLGEEGAIPLTRKSSKAVLLQREMIERREKLALVVHLGRGEGKK